MEGLFHPGRRRCAPIPSARISHSALDAVDESSTVKRNRLPSGDHRGHNTTPLAVNIFRFSLLPSSRKRLSLPPDRLVFHRDRLRSMANGSTLSARNTDTKRFGSILHLARSPRLLPCRPSNLLTTPGMASG